MSDTPETRDLAEEVHALRTEVARLNSHRFVRIHNNLPRLLAFNFARGMAVGAVVGSGLVAQPDRVPADHRRMGGTDRRTDARRAGVI
jgi:hypothetical protein